MSEVKKWHYEYKSKASIFGIPLIHINLGRESKTAKGIIAIGNKAYGLIAIGLFALGLISIGGLCIGIVSIGLVSLSIFGLASIISIAVVANGVIAIGVIAQGVVAVGSFAFGPIAFGKWLAVGGQTSGYICVYSKTAANASYMFNVNDAGYNAQTVITIIDNYLPKSFLFLLDWAKALIK